MRSAAHLGRVGQGKADARSVRSGDTHPRKRLDPAIAVMILGLLALAIPSFIDLARDVWPRDDQGHGPLILAVSAWLAWQRRGALRDCADRPQPLVGGVLLALGLFCYLLGRTQKIDTIEVGALLPLLAGLLLLAKGWGGLRIMAFPLFFLIFLVPLPGLFVQWVTTPLKMAVSSVAESVLAAAAYPVARTGVILQVGPYQLLVADACAGLNSMFTLEALSLLYLSVVGHTSLRRNLFLAVMALPVAFCANVVRVIILVLLTYHFGDRAGQGFLHGFAGMLLFLVALLMILSLDGAWGAVARATRRLTARTLSRSAGVPS